MREFYHFVAIIVICIALIFICAFGVITTLQLTVSPLSCRDFGKYTGMKTTHSFWDGCFVELPDGRIVQKSVFNDITQKEYKVKISE
ncbi:MAG: hypothetical protein DRO67_01185 [Candidatus Asgardarchaeum californiense]|nr:MAG: hypothetical protein DRO67_01185 [Candidatus Asgardarchaeum californiense]